jgi:hypothetical protein
VSYSFKKLVVEAGNRWGTHRKANVNVESRYQATAVKM